MNRFLKSIGIIFFLIVVINSVPWLLHYYAVDFPERKNSEIEGNLILLEENAKYDYMLMGTSHARMFARGNGQEAFEGAMNAKALNLGLGAGNSKLQNQILWYDYATKEKNIQADTLITVLDTFIVCYVRLQAKSYVYEYEPLDPGFLRFLIEKKVDNMEIYRYACLSYLKIWNYENDIFKKEIYPDTGLTQALEENINKRKKGVCSDQVDTAYFEQKKKEYRAFLNDAVSIHKKVYVIMTPSFVPWVGTEEVLEWVKTDPVFKKCTFIDFNVPELMKPEYFVDTDHLNSKGIKAFVKVLRDYTRKDARKAGQVSENAKAF